MKNLLFISVTLSLISLTVDIKAQELIDYSRDQAFYSNAYSAVFLSNAAITQKERKTLERNWGESIPLIDPAMIDSYKGQRIIAYDLFGHPTSGVKQLVAFEYDPELYDWRDDGASFPEGLTKLAYLLIDVDKVDDGLIPTYLLALKQMMTWGADYQSYAELEPHIREGEWFSTDYMVFIDSLDLTAVYRRPEMREKIGADCVRLYEIQEGQRWSNEQGKKIIFVERFVENRRKTQIIHTYLLSLGEGIRFFVEEEMQEDGKLEIGRAYLSFLFSETPANPLDKRVPLTKKVVSVPRQ